MLAVFPVNRLLLVSPVSLVLSLLIPMPTESGLNFRSRQTFLELHRKTAL